MEQASRNNVIKTYGGILKNVLPKMTDKEEELPVYIQMVHGIFDTYGVPHIARTALMMPYITPKASRLVCKFTEEIHDDFNQFVAVLLREYKLTARQYRNNFMTSVRKADESWCQYSSRVDTLLSYYLASRQVTELAALKDLIVADHLKDTLPSDILKYVVDKEGEECYKYRRLAELSDVYESNHGTMSKSDEKPASVKFTGASKQDTANSSAKGSNSSSEKRNPRDRSRSQSRSQRDVSTITCYGCQGRGHYRKDCPSTDHGKWTQSKSMDSSKRDSGHQNSSKSVQPSSARVVMSSDNNTEEVVAVNLCNTMTSVLCNTTARGEDVITEQCGITEDCSVFGKSMLSALECNRVQITTSVPNLTLSRGAAEPIHVELDPLHHVRLWVDGSILSGIVDSGCQLTVMRKSKLKKPFVDLHKSILLRGAFGSDVHCHLTTVRVSIFQPGNEVNLNLTSDVLTVAITDELNSDVDCLLTSSDYDKLCTIQELAVLRSGRSTSTFAPDLSGTDQSATPVRLESKEIRMKNTEMNDELYSQSIDRKYNIEEMKKDQLSDSTLTPIFVEVKRGAHDYFINPVDELLYHRENIRGLPVSQLVVPSTRRKDVMRLAHDSVWGGHLGYDKTLERIRYSFFWPSINQEVSEYCRTCHPCQFRKRRTCWDCIPITPIPRPDECFAIVHADILGPLKKSRSGCQYVLCVVDQFSRWADAVPLRVITARATCDGFLQILSRIGIPTTIVTDNAGNFTSEMTLEFYRLFGCTPRFVSPQHPEGNGLVERFIGTFKGMLHHVILADEKNWDKLIPFILWAYREIPNSTLGVSPNQLVYGRQGRGPLSLLKEVWSGDQTIPANVKKSTTDYLVELKRRIQVGAEIAEENWLKMQDKYTKQYNRRSRYKSFEPGDEVTVFEKDSTSKVEARWTRAHIHSRQSADSYWVDFPNGGRRVVQANKLKKLLTRNSPSASLSVIGVIHEDDEDFGDVLECPRRSSQTGSRTRFSDHVKTDCHALSANQQKELTELLIRYEKVFDDKPGASKLGSHKVRLKDGASVPRTKLYPIPISLQDEVEKQVQELLADGLITRFWSPYAHPVVFVKKKDGSIRMATDYRTLNDITVDDRFPVPNIDEFLMELGASKFISSLDCSAGYFQIPMEEQSKEMTAFATKSGLYQWNVMSFGMKNAGSTFQRTMNEMLYNLRGFARTYIDDIAVKSENWEDHIVHLEKVLRCILETGITLKLKKCSFAKSHIKFLGHQIGSGSHSVDEDKVKAIQDIPYPSTRKKVQSFLGLAGYYQKYIARYAEIARPLTELTKKDVKDPIVMNEVERAAVDDLKDKLSHAPVLRVPDYSLPFILECDASAVAIGGILAQKVDDEVKPVAFMSSKLNPTQQAWSAVEREAYAVVASLKKFDRYVYGNEIKVWTDHNPLLFLPKTLPRSSKLIRWRLALDRYNIAIFHRPGKLNGNSDALSRL